MKIITAIVISKFALSTCVFCEDSARIDFPEEISAVRTVSFMTTDEITEELIPLMKNGKWLKNGKEVQELIPHVKWIVIEFEKSPMIRHLMQVEDGRMILFSENFGIRYKFGVPLMNMFKNKLSLTVEQDRNDERGEKIGSE